MQDIARTIANAGGFLLAGLSCVFFFYAVALSVLYPAILVMFARAGTFASCFRLREAFDLISKNAGPFFTAWGLSLVGGLGVGLITGIFNLVVGWIPCIGWIASLVISFASGIYIAAVYAHLFGQFAVTAFGKPQLTPADQSLPEAT